MADEVDPEAIRERMDRGLEFGVVKRLDVASLEQHVVVMLTTGQRALIARRAVPGIESMHEMEGPKRVERAVDGREVRPTSAPLTQAVDDVLGREHAPLIREHGDDGSAATAGPQPGVAEDRLSVRTPPLAGFGPSVVRVIVRGVGAAVGHAAACTGFAHCHSSPKLRIAAMIGSSASPIAVRV